MAGKKEIIKVALADDHILLRNALATMIGGFDGCRVINQSNNGKELINAVTIGIIPDLIILDINMPEMNGFETAAWLYKHHPQINILVLSMYDSELSLIRLLRNGVKSFLKKDIHPQELQCAIHSVMEKGYYYTTQSSRKMAKLFQTNEEGNMKLQRALLSEQEFGFLQLACSDLTYKEIAQKMELPIRSIDTLRDHLFIKLDVKSRVGLAMVAIRNGVVTI